MMVGPNLDLLEKVVKADESMIAEESAENLASGEHMKIGARSLLKEAVLMLYIDGRAKEAQHWFDYLKGKYPESIDTNLTLNAYALARLGADMSGMDRNKVIASIQGLLRQAYTALAQDQDDAAVTYDKMAQQVWNQFTEQTERMSKDRLELEPMALYKRKVLDELLDPETGPIGAIPELAAILRTKLNLPAPGASVNAPGDQPSAAENSK
jgi:hypothetical protein